MERSEKLAGAALVLSFVAFIAAGNPHIEERTEKHSEYGRVEFYVGEEVVNLRKLPDNARDVICEGDPQDAKRIGPNLWTERPFAVEGSSGYCYYTEAWKTQSETLVFYGMELFSARSDVVEVRWNGS